MAAANAGRKARHPNLKLLNGRTATTDSGGREVKPAPNLVRGTPVKPATLSADAEWLWDQVIEQLETTGLLKPLDAAGLEVACETFARWRDAVRWRAEHGLIGRNSQGAVAAPFIGIEERASKDFRAWCAEFGFTPASEKNLAEGGAGGADGPNPFA
ncbi:terminase small subunit [Arthrobacter phage Shambre1]|uniref:Terminase small subunit n=1 Tax=Arthrobacter phage Shambre1 TaxID=2927284 RepID=A0A977PRZ0_9CAUD|nr:terminase small subunit [Arthrobacter phage Shambre1]UXE04739.1 terminase small subunit [Arthrobacter phage Shambre1]